jgi:hypothetical protein
MTSAPPLTGSFDKYYALVLRRNGLHHLEEVKHHPSRKHFIHEGHYYEWDTDCVHRLLGWLPWQEPTMNPLKFLWQWVERRYTSVGLLIYNELPDAPDPSLLIDPLTHSTFVAKGYTRITPQLFRGAMFSVLYSRYEKATRWGIGMPMKKLLLIFGAFAAVLIILYFAGVWK